MAADIHDARWFAAGECGGTCTADADLVLLVELAAGLWWTLIDEQMLAASGLWWKARQLILMTGSRAETCGS